MNGGFLLAKCCWKSEQATLSENLRKKSKPCCKCSLDSTDHFATLPLPLVLGRPTRMHGLRNQHGIPMSHEQLRWHVIATWKIFKFQPAYWGTPGAFRHRVFQIECYTFDTLSSLVHFVLLCKPHLWPHNELSTSADPTPNPKLKSCPSVQMLSNNINKCRYPID